MLKDSLQNSWKYLANSSLVIAEELRTHGCMKAAEPDAFVKTTQCESSPEELSDQPVRAAELSIPTLLPCFINAAILLDAHLPFRSLDLGKDLSRQHRLERQVPIVCALLGIHSCGCSLPVGTSHVLLSLTPMSSAPSSSYRLYRGSSSAVDYNDGHDICIDVSGLDSIHNFLRYVSPRAVSNSCSCGHYPVIEPLRAMSLPDMTLETQSTGKEAWLTTVDSTLRVRVALAVRAAQLDCTNTVGRRHQGRVAASNRREILDCSGVNRSIRCC